MMELKNKVIRTLLKEDSGVISELAKELGRSEATIRRYIRVNDDNLTKAAALRVICKKTGLMENELLKKVYFKKPRLNKREPLLTIAIRCQVRKG